MNSVHPGPIYTNLIKNYGLTEEDAADPVNSILPPHIGDRPTSSTASCISRQMGPGFLTSEELVIDGGY